MAKSTTDQDFLNAYRATRPATQDAASPKMKLNTPPSGASKSLDQLVAASEQSETETARAATGGDVVALRESGYFAPPDTSLGRMISIDLLDTHPWNARVHRDVERIREIASQIAATRQLSPITVTRNPGHPERRFVVDGETRFRSLKSLNRKEAWVLEIDVDPSNAAAFYAASFKQTDATEQISAIDKGIRWGALIDGGHASAASIAEMLEVNQSTISRMLSYKKFPLAVLDFMHTHAEKFPYSVAAALAPILEQTVDETRLLTICQKIVDEDYSRRAIEALVKTSSAGAKQHRKSALVSRPIKTGNTQVGSFRTYESGALEFKLAAANPLPEASVKALSDILELASDLLSEGAADLTAELIARLARKDDGT